MQLFHIERLNTLLSQLSPHVSDELSSAVKVRICINPSRSLNPRLLDWSFTYATVDEVVESAAPEAHISLIDYEQYFKQLPIDPRQHHLFGFAWDAEVFECIVCPFGVKHGPAHASTFTAVACDFLSAQGIRSVAYIDDIAIVSSTYQQALADRDKALAIFEELGLRVSPTKVTLPSQTPTFLGITINTVQRTLSIATDKLALYLDHITFLLERTRGTVRSIAAHEIHSLVGKLERVSSVFFTGKRHLALLRHGLPYVGGKQIAYGSIPITPGLRPALLWWYSTLSTLLSNPSASTAWSRFSPLPSAPTISLWSDASDTTGGFGLIASNHLMLQGTAHLQLSFKSSGTYEYLPLLHALRLWGDSWRSHTLLWFCDNANNTRVMNRGAPSAATSMSIAHDILELTCSLDITLFAVWVPRRSVQLLDDLSKDVIRLAEPATYPADPSSRRQSGTPKQDSELQSSSA
jgi:hypothetical protein